MGNPSLIILWVVVVAAFLPTSLAVQCYICSWSPKDEDKRTNVCTNERFEPNVVYIGECEFGCETFLQWDKNNDLEHMRRNCVQKDTEMTGKCEQDENLARSWRHCTCKTDLCNGAISWAPGQLLVFMAALALFAKFF